MTKPAESQTARQLARQGHTIYDGGANYDGDWTYMHDPKFCPKCKAKEKGR